MASISVPIKLDLPDNWMDLILERIKEDGDWELVTRCKDCKHYEPDDIESDWCGAWGGTTNPNSFCSFAEAKMEVEHETD